MHVCQWISRVWKPLSSPDILWISGAFRSTSSSCRSWRWRRSRGRQVAGERRHISGPNLEPGNNSKICLSTKVNLCRVIWKCFNYYCNFLGFRNFLSSMLRFNINSLCDGTSSAELIHFLTVLEHLKTALSFLSILPGFSLCGRPSIPSNGFEDQLGSLWKIIKLLLLCFCSFKVYT